jgi:hypothetical protein
MSNAWEDDEPHPDGLSGLGMEFILETPVFEEWAVHITANLLAFQLLLIASRLGDGGPLDRHHRVPLGSPIDGKTSALTYVTLVVPPAFPDAQRLESGTFELLQIVGISEPEVAFARKEGGDALVRILSERTAFPVTDALRASIL